MSRYESSVKASCGHGARWNEDRKQFGYIVLKNEIEPELICGTCFCRLMDEQRKNGGIIKKVLIHEEWCEV